MALETFKILNGLAPPVLSNEIRFLNSLKLEQFL
jgi:hypothetical protein